MTLSEPTIGPAEISGIDLLCPHLYATRDPQIIWSYLRRHAPVHHQSLPDGRAFWVVTRHSDVVRVLSDHGSFTSEKGTMLCILGSDDPAGGRMMAVTDPPNHSRLRDPLVR